MAEIKTRKRGELKPCAFRPRESVNRSRCDIELEYQEGARTRRITLSLPWDEAEAIADLVLLSRGRGIDVGRPDAPTGDPDAPDSLAKNLR